MYRQVNESKHQLLVHLNVNSSTTATSQILPPIVPREPVSFHCVLHTFLGSHLLRYLVADLCDTFADLNQT